MNTVHPNNGNSHPQLVTGTQITYRCVEILRLETKYLVLVRLHDGSFRDREELISADVCSHHHGQHRQQLLLGQEMEYEFSNTIDYCGWVVIRMVQMLYFEF
jgi:hypothetical protein